MYEINEHEILKVEEVVTSKQTAIIKQHFGMVYKVELAASKLSILDDGIDYSVIIATVKKGLIIDDDIQYNITNDITQVIFNIDGQELIQNVVGGIAKFDFLCEYEGIVKIETMNEMVENAYVEVDVYAKIK